MNKGHMPSSSSRRSTVAGAGKTESEAGLNGRRQRRAAETRIRLFRCALELIAERGLDEVTVKDITEAADVGKGTFFNYFPSKDHVLGVMAEIQVGKVKEAAAQAADGKKPIHSVLRHLVHRLAEEPGRNPRLARALFTSFLANDSVRTIMKRIILDGRKTIAEVIGIGQQRGEIDPRLDKKKVATQFFQTIMGTGLVWSLYEKPPLDAWVENSFQQVWKAIAAPDKKRES